MGKNEDMKEARRLWVEALRSGEYEQGRKVLCMKNEFCCLGVACDLFVKSRPNVIRVKVDDDGITTYGHSRFYMPKSVQEWLGLNSDTGKFFPGDAGTVYLSNLNDGGITFAEIADIIESEPEGLFITEPA